MKNNELPIKVAKIEGKIIAFVGAIVGGLILFLATSWLLIKGGDNVGSHLNLLSHYFPGYSVSWSGCLVGAFYGLIVGGILGWSIGFFYNLIVNVRHSPN